MNEILFPGLNLKFNISKIALKLGNANIYWYAIFIVLAMCIGLILMKKDDGKYNIKFENIIYLMVFLIPISFIGARIYYVIFKLDYYMKDFAKIFNFRDGGLAIYGGIIAGIITIIVYCKVNKIKVLDMLDYIAPFLPLGQAMGRWGNFFNMEAHGTEATNIFRMGIIENGIYTEVHPTFLYESVCTLIIFIILMNIRNKRKYSGEITYIYLSLYAFVRFFIEGLRTDSLMIGNLRVSQILSAIVFVTFTSIIFYKKFNLKKENKNEK